MSKLHLNVRSGASTRPGEAAVAPLSIRRCQGSASVKFHWIVVPGATEVSIWRRSPSNSIAVASAFGLTWPLGAPR